MIGEEIGVKSMSFGDNESKLSMPLSWSNVIAPENVKMVNLVGKSKNIFEKFMRQKNEALLNSLFAHNANFKRPYH